MIVEITDYITFECSKCGDLHICDEKEPRTEIFKVPPTITTSFNKVSGWYLHCVDKETCAHESAINQYIRANAEITQDKDGVLHDAMGSIIPDVHQWHRNHRQKHPHFGKMSAGK